MDPLLVIWALGATIVMLSWTGRVSPKLGWFAFLSTTALSLVQWVEVTAPPFWWLWLIGIASFLASWVFRWHAVGKWAGVMLTFLAACMELVHSFARQLIGEPIVVITPSIDMFIIVLVFSVLGNVHLCRAIQRRPELLALLWETARIRALARRLSEREHHERFAGRIDFLTDMEGITELHMYERMGNEFLLSVFLSIILFALTAANYYGSGTAFNYVLFSTNWLWSAIISLAVVYIPLVRQLDGWLKRLEDMGGGSRGRHRFTR